MDPSTILPVAVAIAACAAIGAWLWFHPSRRTYDPDALVTLAEFGSASDARLWKMRLESMGVPCVLQNEIFNRADPGLATDISAVRLQVMGRDVHRAKRVLASS